MVPSTGRQYNGPREAVPQKEKTGTTPPQATGATRPDTLPQESDGGELVDGEMIYLDGGGSVVSITTCSDTDGAGTDRSNQEEPPPLNSRLRQTPTAANNQAQTGANTSAHKEELALTMVGNMKRAGRKHC